MFLIQEITHIHACDCDDLICFRIPELVETVAQVSCGAGLLAGPLSPFLSQISEAF